MDAFFSAPAALWALAFAPLIVLLHTLKFRPKKFVVPSLRLWREHVREPLANTFWQRIRRWRELALQLLALLCLSFALAGVRIPDQGEPPRNLLILLDTSASMAAIAEGQRTRFDLATEWLQAELESASPDDRYGLIMLGERALMAIPMGASSVEVIEAISAARVRMVELDPGVLRRSISRYAARLGEDAGMLVVSGPFDPADVGTLPSSISLRSFGAPRANRGIAAARWARNGDQLAIKLSLFASRTNEQGGGVEATPVPLVLDVRRGLRDQIEKRDWQMQAAVEGDQPYPSFVLAAPGSQGDQVIEARLRFEKSDFFPADDLVTMRWEAPAKLAASELLGPRGAAAENYVPAPLLSLLRVLGMKEQSSGGTSIQRLWIGRRPSPDSEGGASALLLPPDVMALGAALDGTLSYEPYEWWQDLVLEDLGSFSGLTGFELLDDSWQPLLYAGGIPVAAAREGNGYQLVLAAELLENEGFLRSDTFLTLITRWYQSTREALHPRVQGAIASRIDAQRSLPPLLSVHESREVSQGASYHEDAELPPGMGDSQPLELAPWLLALGIGLIALEWILAWRVRRG